MTLLDLSLLGLLADQPMHGYELSKRLRELGDGRAGVSFGSLYPRWADSTVKDSSPPTPPRATERPACP